MRLAVCVILGKLLSLLLKPFGKGSDFPGSVALKLYPELLKQFRMRGKILAVTGSNGKTSSANLITYILRKQGFSVAANQEGSNMPGGIATAFIKNAKLNGLIDRDFAVLEVDERYSPLIFAYFDPDLMLVTNLFRDQLTRNGNVDVISAKLSAAIRPSVKLILNANDPISVQLAPSNERVYYGMEQTSQSSEFCRNITHDAKVCPVCLHRLHYAYYHYNHIGAYSCPACGYHTPEMHYPASQVDQKRGIFFIKGFAVNTSYPSLFHILNMTGAIAACCELGIPLQISASAAGSFPPLENRFRRFQIGKRDAVMILSKNQNPVSFDQSISYILGLEEEKSVVIYVNNINHTNHKDTTWLYDINFERLRGNVDSVVCVGPRAYDLAVRLQYAGFPPGAVKAETMLSKAGETVRETNGTLCILTEVYDAEMLVGAIAKRSKSAPFVHPRHKNEKRDS